MSGAGTAGGSPTASEDRLLPYLPRLVVEWLRTDPDSSWRILDGSMVFIDVSGFTALSERLARRGKAGAEELTDVLDTVFARLLTRAWELGGGLLKFGGDALLLLFDGEDHAARAAAGAFDLRTELAAAGRLETSAGLLELQMSVGVHSGELDFFLVGGSHRELVLAGPGATLTVEAEGTAGAGEIVLSAGAAARLDPAVVGEPAGTGRMLRERPEARPNLVVAGELPGLPLAGCVPVALRRQLLAPVTEPEHRVVTTAFVHVGGADRMLAERGPEATALAMDTVVSAVQRHVDEYDVCFLGSDVYEDGGKLILTAGAPTMYGNDEERMLRALRAVLDEELPLPLRIGVNRGHVYAGEVGPPARRTYTVMGDAVNLAARLMQAARPGQMLVSEPVLDRSDTAFDVEVLPPFRVKGKSRPVQAYAVGSIAGWQRRVEQRRLPLVGRELELGRLLEAADSARRGEGRVVQLIGPAGLGKTRLTEEVRSRLDDLRQYRISCEQYEAATPYWPFRLLLRRLLDIPLDASPEEAGPLLELGVAELAPQLAPWLPLLGIVAHAAVPPTDDVDQIAEEFRRAQLERTVLDLLEVALQSPTAIVLEDIYWMDEASRSLVHHVGQAAVAQPWLLLLTNRDADRTVMPDEPATHGELLRLSQLTSEEMRALASAASAAHRTHRPVQDLTQLTDRAAGSPLFLLELLAGAADGAAVPDSIEAAITARIDTLDPADRLVLRCAAVLGRPSFPLGLAEEILPVRAPGAADDDVWDRLGEFIVREAHDRLRFDHVMIRDVAYEGLPFRRRRELHAAVAEWVERNAPDPDEQAELLALHSLRAERFDRALHYSRVAGDRARAKAATADAAHFYQQGLEAAQAVGDVAEHQVADLAEALGEVSELAGLYDDGARAYRLARRLVRNDRRRCADLLRKEGFLRERSGRYEQARLLYRTGLRELDDTPESHPIRARLEAVMAAALMWEGRWRACIWWAQRSARHAEEATAPAVLAHAYYLLDAAYTDLGLAEESRAYRGRALPIFEELGDLVGQANVLNNLGANAYYEGHWDEALDYYERSGRAREKAGDIVQAATATSNIAEVLCQQGDSARAEQLFRDALRVFRGAGYEAGVAFVTGYLGLTAARLGRIEEGKALLRESREICRDLGMSGMALEASARLVEVSLLAGEAEEAQAIAASVSDEIEAKGGMPFLEGMLGRLQVHALAQRGEVDAAFRAVDVSVRLAEAADAVYEVALCLDTKARLAELLGRPDEGAGERAAALLGELGVHDPPRVPLPAERSRVGQAPSTAVTAGS